ncbi:MAG: phosphatidylglycerol lysyltransferase domain-containing protein [Desulfovibrio desulfuricans]|uniref:Phosphatidylglycerol lysyltransferase C-terminal domain-containing protein n=1 Tax=Desulfovibrio desulfuricans (strain ATCC 27774 / DSM 6949 / MB) TaxID=525146 RepID=B8J170_DESDA|nr:phosphatidylglycerol lysyltransferase domain-containing protein [Desulfovibrio desulfuricans]
MSKKFIPVSLDDSQRYYDIWQRTPQRSLDYTLANLWGWQEYYGLEWCFEDSMCWIRQTRPYEVCWAPVGDWNAVDWKSLLPCSFNETAHEVVRVPEELLHVWQERLPGLVDAEEDRGQWEYLYKQEELADLPGNRFHKKRNHYNSYIKNYGEPDYHDLDDRMIEDVLAVQDDWCQWHECEDSPSLRAENEAINRVLSHWNSFRSLVGGSLYVDGKMVAFSVGENLDGTSLGVHYEKGLSGFKGVYQTINCTFARRAGTGFTYINRAQDLDEEGLRQAKMTYMPTDFLRKYKVRIRKA